MRNALVAMIGLAAFGAWADPPCTVTGSVNAGAPVPGQTMDGIILPYDIPATWNMSATVAAGASCSNLSLAYFLNLEPTGIHDGGGVYTPNGDGSAGSGTSSIEADYAGNFTVWGSLGCGCGDLGGDLIDVPSNSVLIPPILDSSVILPSETQVNPNPPNWDGDMTDVPVGLTLNVDTGVSAVLCPGDTLTFTVSGAGVNQTATIPATTYCDQDTFTPTSLSFTPTAPGTLTLRATLDGATSNVVSMTVVAAPASSTGGSTGGSTSGSSSSGGNSPPKVGCQAAPGDLPPWTLLAALACLRGRRRS